MVYYCKKCKYKYTKENPPSRCPYCSSEGTLVKQKTAQDLLDDSMDDMLDPDRVKRTGRR